ncbi:hypothetical protein G6011_02150 [Alternaria panax]|uniref:Uncharacterized protein n=1 Tax=Alternaria panax TaxID=48097 RepID=A0AAD4FDU0_9PLEO|nr:hypothetical protein G6011_02150 [Alternaria panax]
MALISSFGKDAYCERRYVKVDSIDNQALSISSLTISPYKAAAGDNTPKAKKAPAVKRSGNKIVKRPARGYHKFKNDLLNDKPKGGEKALTKQNQSSPLLQLPPGICNEIWRLILGGKVYRVFDRKFAMLTKRIGVDLKECRRRT